MASIATAKKRLEELGYDPIEALVEIARNRNQIGDLRLKAAMALLPYAYTPMTAKMDLNVTHNTGVMAVPAPMDEESWSNTVKEMKNRAAAAAAVSEAVQPQLPAPESKGIVH